MTQQNNDISIDEAKAALNSIETANRVAYESLSPPLWLRLLLALMLGALTVFCAWSSGSSLWTFVTFAMVAAIAIIFVSYYCILKSRGIKLLLSPKNRSQKKINFLGGFFTGFLLMVSIELYRGGFTWIPYLTAFANVLIVLYLMSKYSESGIRPKQG